METHNLKVTYRVGDYIEVSECEFIQKNGDLNITNVITPVNLLPSIAHFVYGANGIFNKGFMTEEFREETRGNLVLEIPERGIEYIVLEGMDPMSSLQAALFLCPGDTVSLELDGVPVEPKYNTYRELRDDLKRFATSTDRANRAALSLKQNALYEKLFVQEGELS